MGYVIAAYAIVLGSLLFYAGRLYLRRRELARRRGGAGGAGESQQ